MRVVPCVHFLFPTLSFRSSRSDEIENACRMMQNEFIQEHICHRREEEKIGPIIRFAASRTNNLFCVACFIAGEALQSPSREARNRHGVSECVSAQ